MSTINGMPIVSTPIYDEVNQSGSESNQNTGGSFSDVLNDMLKEQALQSTMMRMSSPAGAMGGLGGTNAMLGGLGGLGGTNAMIGGMGGLGGIGGIDGMMGGFMPSISSGMENTLISAAGSGEMSGAQLMLFMMIMMMQSGGMGGGGSDMMPIMQMLAGMLSNFSEDASSVIPNPNPNNMLTLGDMQDEDTRSDIKRMVDAALSQVGYQEKNRDGSPGRGNITKFGAWYGMDGQPWCAMFVSWAADQAGILNDVVPKHASTARGVAAYQEVGLYAPGNSGYQPSEGDAIYFQSANGRIKHVGIVVAFDPSTQRVYTVEGNTDNAVRLRHYGLNDRYIHGFGRNGGTSFGTIPMHSTEGSDASTI